ncbi:MAG: EamA family transporter [Duodenibacillus sp.]|nr:EamA family transporter [Duodenibacillus sp.]
MLLGQSLAGVFLVIVAGLAWGSMGVVGQYLMQEYRFLPTDLVAARLVGAGIFLLGIDALQHPERLRTVFKDRSLIVTLTVYGVGLLVIQWTFFMAIQTSNAGTAAIMVMMAPVFIVFYYLFSGKRVFPLEWVSVVLALLGVVLIVTKGRWDSLDLSSVGVLWGLASAAGGAFCTLYPRRAMQRVGVTTCIGIGMTVGGMILCVVYPPWNMDVVWNLRTMTGYAYIVLVGTVAAFWCYFKSMDYISPTATSVLTAFEPLSAVLLSVWWLDVSMSLFEVWGAVLILSTVFLLGRGSKADRRKRA